MAIDPQIALSVKPVQLPDLAQSYGTGIQLRNAIQQGQMNAEKLKQEQRTNQMADLDAQDQLKLRDVYSKAGGDPEKTVQGAIQAGVSPKSVQGLQQNFADYAEKVAKTKSDELATDKYKADQMLGLHDQAIQLATTNPQAYAAAWPQLYAAAVKAEPDAEKHLDPNTPPTVDQLQLSKAGYVTHTSFLTAEEEKRKQAEEVRKQAEESRKAAMAVPQLAEAGAKATSALRQEDANTIAQAAKQGGPPAIAAAIRQLPAERRAPFAGLTGKEKPEDILAIGTTPAEQVTAGLTKSRNQQTVENEKRLRDIAQGHLAVAQNQQKIAQNVYEQTYGAGANPALVGVEPKLRSQAATAAQKAADDYAKSVSAANDMKSFIDLARKGNKEAAAYMSPEGVLTLNTGRGVTRVNRQEMEAYGAAGSLIDHIQGKIGKLVSGQPIPPDVIKDIETLHQTLEGNAAKNYNTKLGGINQNYRSNFQPIKGEEKTATPSGVPEITSQADYEKLPKGAKYTNNGVPHVKQ